MVRLGDIAEVLMGQAPPSAATNEEGIGYPLIAGAGDFSSTGISPKKFTHISARLAQPGDIVISIRATVGPFRIAAHQYALGRGVASLRPSNDIDRSFFSHYINHAEEQLKLRGRGATFLQISRRDLTELEIPLPPIEEQQRIAGILDTSDQLADNLSKKLELLEDLEKSSYLSQFAAEKVVAPTQKLASPAKNSIRTGPFGSQLKHDEFVDEGISVLGLDNVVSNRFRWEESRHITPEKYEQLKRYTVHPGDVLISIMGTTGRCVIVPEGIPTTINTKHICAITVNHSLMLPEFLRASFLWHPEVRQSLRQQTKGSIMAGLNMGIIKNLLLPLPDISKQQEWVSVSEKINLARHQLLKELTQVESLKVSLQTRAFQGLL